MRMLVIVASLLLGPALAAGQYTSSPPASDQSTAADRPAAGVNREQGAPGSAGPGAVQHGAQPNPAEVRPGSRDGDAPSAAPGTVVTEPARRVFGLPVTTALVIGGLIVAIAVLSGLLVPRSRYRDRARGGGTYGGADRP